MSPNPDAGGNGSHERRTRATIADLVLTPYYYLLYGIVLLAATLLALKPLGEHLIGDATIFCLVVANQTGFNVAPYYDISAAVVDFGHPLLYVGILMATGWLFGPSLLSFRLFGVACLVVDLVLIRKIADQMTSSTREARLVSLLASTLFLLMPYAIDGSLHIDIDTSVLPVICLAFTLTFALFVRSTGRRRMTLGCAVSLLFSLGLWAKLTTPLLLPLAAFGYCLCTKQKLRTLLLHAMLFVIGAGVFMGTWHLLCTACNFPTLSVFRRILSVFASKVGGPSLDVSELGRTIVVISFAFNPLLMVVWLLALGDVMRRIVSHKPNNDVTLYLAILTPAICLGYCMIGRLTYGVPKYHLPFAPLAALLAASFLGPVLARLSIRKFALGAVAGILSGLLFAFIPDPLYVVNHELKAAAFSGRSFTPSLVLLSIAAVAYFASLGIAIVLWITGRKNVAWEILMFSILMQLVGYNLRQSLAPYQIAYSYGVRGIPEAFRRISDCQRFFVPEATIIAPTRYSIADTVDNLARMPAESGSDATKATFWRAYLLTYRPEAVVCGPAFNTVSQLKTIFLTPGFESIVGAYYERVQYWDATVYLRKPVE